MTTPDAAEPLVTKEVADGVAVLTFNRPERNNAWSVPMEREYYRLLRECGEDPAVRVIVVTGAGKSFCPDWTRAPCPIRPRAAPRHGRTGAIRSRCPGRSASRSSPPSTGRAPGSAWSRP